MWDMLEREFEILIRLAKEEFLPSDWNLKAQQLSLPSGRLDMLFIDSNSITHIVELKKGSAPKAAIDQVLKYIRDIQLKYPSKKFVPWVIAHEISESTKIYANENEVKTLAISRHKCSEVMEKKNITTKDLVGIRLSKKTLHGGGSGIKSDKQIDNEVVFREVSENVSKILREINKIEYIDMTSGTMQTLIHYKGVKLGGFNRKHRGGHGYISDGVVLSDQTSDKLKELNFIYMTKNQSGSSHEHVWWEIKESNIKNLLVAIKLCIATVESEFD